VVYLHARYADGFLFSGTGVNPAIAALSIGDDPLTKFGNQTQLVDLSGQATTRAPDCTANVGVEYNVSMRNGGLRLNEHANYTPRHVINNPSIWCALIGTNTCAGVPEDRRNYHRFTEDGFVLLSACVQYTLPDRHAYVRVFGNNLTDHRYRVHNTAGRYCPWQSR
jgi:iron complex outermembrane recepter protein